MVIPLQNPSEITARPECDRILWPQQPPLNIHRLLIQRLRSSIKPKPFIYGAHYIHQLRLQLWVFCESCANIIRCLVEDLSGSDAVATSLAGVRYLEHAGREICDSSCTVAFPRNAA